MAHSPGRRTSLIIEVIGSAVICAATLATEIILERAARIRHPQGPSSLET